MEIVVYREKILDKKINEETKDLRAALISYLDLMDTREYFEAHEVLEEAWHPMRKEKDPLQNLVKGLINAAVAFEHLKRAKPESQRRARKVIASFDRHKRLCTGDIREANYFVQACQQVCELKKSHSEIFDVLVS